MKTEESCTEAIDDIRWTTLCHHANDLLNTHKMRNLERVNLAAYIAAQTIRNLPEKDKFRWLSHVIQEISSQSAGLHLVSVAEKS